MRSNGELNDEIRRGQESSSFLNNPLFQQAVSDARDEVFHRWTNSDPGDCELREQLYHEWQALSTTLRGLQKPITAGRLAAKEKDMRTYQENLG
jgi:hypothetical protein